MLPGKGAPSAVVGTVRIDDVGITHALDWKRVPQVRLCVCGGGNVGTRWRRRASRGASDFSEGS